MWVSLQGHRSVGQPTGLLCIQDKVKRQQPRTMCRNWPAQACLAPLPDWMLQPVPHLALRGESAPHCYRVLRCGCWEKWE